MKNYDWIVVGGGITGVTLAWELADKGLRVLLLEKNEMPDNASHYSYGGLAYWAGYSPLTRQLCEEGREIQSQLQETVGIDNEFQERQLLLTITPEQNPEEILKTYQNFAIEPRLLSVAETREIEPLINPEAIAATLLLSQGHINPGKTTRGYLRAYRNLGGEVKTARVAKLLSQGEGNRIQGVETQTQEQFFAANTVICAGGLSRALLRKSGLEVKIYFTHTEVIITPPVELQFQAMIMPAEITRFELEAQASQSQLEPLWNQPGHQLLTPILDPGVIQFQDGSLRIGQLSRILTDPQAGVEKTASEAEIRARVGHIVPAIRDLPGSWHHCLVAFSNNNLPIVGQLKQQQGIYLFSGFTNTLIFAPALARHFARWVTGEKDEIMPQLSPIV